GGAAAAGPRLGPPGGRRPGTVSGTRGPHRARRPLRGALGALVAAAAATVVVGAGWLMTQSGGAADPGAGSAAARADSGDAGGKKEGGAAFEGPRRLVCSRLVAEGTVRAVEQVPGTGAQHVTLEVSRSYRGGGGDEITFLRYPADDAPLREGDRVMVGMPAEGAHPDAVIVGEADIAPERTRITAPPTGPGAPACG
ncbi:hypothetical protein ABTY20_31105, partial [Streptomyces sp. NPDC126497]|uniref:hypothetical protein n=1 Tax=Streptomyces sp. NPDC126497 TaxID=3155313 RepID=UPI0033312416